MTTKRYVTAELVDPITGETLIGQVTKQTDDTVYVQWREGYPSEPFPWWQRHSVTFHTDEV